MVRARRASAMRRLRLRSRSCKYCSRGLSDWGDVGDCAPTIDHKTPLSRGGTNDRENLTVACRRCNQLKGSMTVPEFQEYLDRYGFTTAPRLKAHGVNYASVVADIKSKADR